MNNKERIKDRILKRAAQYWNYSDTELESAFDPVVGLLLEAVSSELEMLSADMDATKTVVLERLLDMMSPESNNGVVPSHSVLHMTPIEHNFVLTKQHQFYFNKIVPNIYNPLAQEAKDIYFGPTMNVKLTSATLKYFALGDSMYALDRIVHKDRVRTSKTFIQPSTMWLGIHLPEQIERLDQLMFYTDIKNNAQRDFYFHYLKQAKFYIGNKEFSCREGFNTHETVVDIDSIVRKNYNKVDRIYAEVNDYYAPYYFYLEESIGVTDELVSTPSEIEEVFEWGEEQKSTDRILWLQIRFPEVLINQTLENVMFYLNTVPVINKKLNIRTQSIDSFINYIPLLTDDIFLDLDKVTDSKGNFYHMKNFESDILGSGNATLRYSGVSRFDERSASEILQYLIEVLKDEGSSFSVLGGDFIDNIIKELYQMIAKLDQHLKEHNFNKSSFPYVVVKPQNALSSNDVYISNFWSTDGELANNIKPNTKLIDGGSSEFIPHSLIMLNSSVGGKSQISTQDKINSYRESLLTRGRIVTFADIKTVCKTHLKHSILSIEILRGTKKDISVNNGFIRTIDILLERNEKMELPLSDDEWNYLCDSLLHKLNTTSSKVYPYRLIVKKREHGNWI